MFQTRGFAQSKPLKQSIHFNKTLNLFLKLNKTKPHHPFEINPNGNANLNYLNDLTHTRVFTLDAQNSWRCRLCLKFPTPENKQILVRKNSKKFMETRIRIEFSDDFNWGDGQSVTGKDLFFTWMIAKNISTPSLRNDFYDRIHKIIVDKKNPRKVSIYLRGSDYLFDTWGDIKILPSHLEEPIWKKSEMNIETYFKKTLYKKQPLLPGLYSGPYLFTEISPDKHLLVLKRNPFYRKHSLPYDRIKVRLKKTKNTNLKYLMRKPGNDIVLPETLFPAHKVEKDLEKTVKNMPNLKIVWGDSTQLEHIAFNPRNPLLRDIRTRKALSLAIDKSTIISDVYQNTVIPALHFIPPQDTNFFYQTNLNLYDLELSKKILEEANWILDEKTGLRFKNGKPLELTIATDNHPQRIKALNNIKNSWKKIGASLKLKVYHRSSFMKKVIAKKMFSDLVLFTRDFRTDINYFDVFHSSSIPNIRNNYEGYNIYTWIDDSVDKLLETQEKEFSQKKKYLYLSSLQKKFTESLPAIPLFFHLKKAIVSKSILNFTIPGNQFYSSTYIYNWHRNKNVSAIENLATEDLLPLNQRVQ